MSGVSRDNHKIKSYVANNYIGWRKWNDQHHTEQQWNPNHHQEQQWNPNLNCGDVCVEWTTVDGTTWCTRYEYQCSGGYEWVWVGGYDTVWVGGWDTGQVDATINGEVNATHNNRVFVNGSPIAVDGDTVNERATYTLPSGAEKTSGNDTGTGTVNATGNVYVGGRQVADNGTNVGIYAGGSTIINEGSSNVFIS